MILRISIPSEMKDVVKHAKSYKEFKEGKAAIKKYYEDTMSERIKKFNRSRSEAVIESMNTSLYPVSVTPFNGNEYFEDPMSFNDSLSQVTKNTKNFLSPSKLKKSASTSKIRGMQSNNSSPDSRNSLDDSSIEMMMSEYLERSFENEVRMEIDSLNLGNDPDSKSLEIILNAPKLEDRRIDNDDISWLSDKKLPKLKL